MSTRVTRQTVRNTGHRTAPAALDVTPPTTQEVEAAEPESSPSPSPSYPPDTHVPKHGRRRTNTAEHREEVDDKLSTHSNRSTRQTKTLTQQRDRAHTLPPPNTRTQSNSHTQEQEQQDLEDQEQQRQEQEEEQKSDAAARASSAASPSSPPLLRWLCVWVAHVLPLMLLLLCAVFLTHPAFHSTRHQVSSLPFSFSSSSFTHQALRTLQTFQQDFNTLYDSLLVAHTPHATNARIYRALDSIITRLADSFPVLSREAQDLLYYSLSAHFDPMQVKPARPLVLCIVEVQHREGEEENKQQTVSAMVHQLSALLYPVPSVSPYLFDVSSLHYATAARIAAALDEQVQHHHNDSVVFFPRINTYKNAETAGHHLTLRQVGELLQYYCDDALAPYSRVVYVLSLVFTASEWQQLPGSTAHDRVYDYLHETMRSQSKEHTTTSDDKYDRAEELIDAVLTRIVRNVIVLHTHVR